MPPEADQTTNQVEPDKSKAPPAPSSNPDDQALRNELETLRKEKLEWEKSNLSLTDKVRKDTDDRAKRDTDTKALEAALMFNLTSSEFIKANESLLPKEVGDIFKAAEKENYSSATEKANATKAAIIQSFFSMQANVDMLTENQKVILSDYLKLTKGGKEEKARQIYENLFEPTLESLKRIKKAEELSRSRNGFKNSSQIDEQYKEKLMSGSRKHYLGEKS